MTSRRSLYLTSVSLVVAMALVAGLPTTGDPGGREPPDPATERFAGPGLVGGVTLTETLPGISVMFAGQCQGEVVLAGPVVLQGFMLPADAAELKGFRIVNGTPLAPSCYPFAGDLFVQAVFNFTQVDANTVTANVVILAVVLR